MTAKLVNKLLELKFGDVQEAVEEYKAKVNNENISWIMFMDVYTEYKVDAVESK